MSPVSYEIRLPTTALFKLISHYRNEGVSFDTNIRKSRHDRKTDDRLLEVVCQ